MDASHSYFSSRTVSGSGPAPRLPMRCHRAADREGDAQERVRSGRASGARRAGMPPPRRRPTAAGLTVELDVDVCVVGGGLAGLTVARELARRGWSVAVLEARRIAWNASGRNTGFVLPGFADMEDARQAGRARPSQGNCGRCRKPASTTCARPSARQPCPAWTGRGRLARRCPNRTTPTATSGICSGKPGPGR